MEQKALTPDAVLVELKEGNDRFAAGKLTEPNVKSSIAAAAKGQFLKAVILSCLDSRIPVEVVFDQEIGDLFVGRVAGNVENDDLLGSFELATKLAGAKLVVVLGHDECGAVKGACDPIEMGKLTGLLKKITPAVEAVEGFAKEQRPLKHEPFVDAVVTQNVVTTVADLCKAAPSSPNWKSPERSTSSAAFIRWQAAAWSGSIDPLPNGSASSGRFAE